MNLDELWMECECEHGVELYTDGLHNHACLHDHGKAWMIQTPLPLRGVL